jgi:hypothetical protein
VLIEAAYTFLEDAHPTSIRGVSYHLFVNKIISSMEQATRVSRLLVDAREEGTIPWEWIVDETREMERGSSWDGLEVYAQTIQRSYRRDFWSKAFQSNRVVVLSEKGTVRGILAPVLDEYGVGFQVLHGWASATTVHDLAQDDDGRPVVALYVGDWDPSGLYMSEVDLPRRLQKYGGVHIEVRRVALTVNDTTHLPSFSVHEKKKDTRYRWFRQHYGDRCWEVDAMHPNTLREWVREALRSIIEPKAWAQCQRVERAEHESLRAFVAACPAFR